MPGDAAGRRRFLGGRNLLLRTIHSMLLREMMSGKIHGIIVTDKNVHYTGSLGVDVTLLEGAGILPNEKIQVVNLTNGHRMWTYALRGGTGECVLNGGMALKGDVGDRLLIISYVQVDDETARALRPKVVVMTSNDNRKHEIRES
jgi:aspartate 1-decarboxylase